MAQQRDHYAVLGVDRDATLDEVRTAYRKAALKLHPDTYEGDRAEAEQRLIELIQAYKAISKSLDPAAWSPTASPEPRTFTPADYAREGYSAFWRDPNAAGEGTGYTLNREELQPTRHETFTFALLWILAIVLGIAVGGAAAVYRAYQIGPENLGTWDIVLAVLLGEVIYVGLAGAAFVLVLLTRKLVKLTIHLAVQGWKFLPTGSHDRELPAESKED